MCVLIVGSDSHYLEAQQNYLQWYGFEIDTLQDSTLAMASLERKEYDILLGSLMMQPLQAMTLFRQIRAHPTKSISSIRILALGLEEPELDEFVQLYELDIGYLSKFRSVEVVADRLRMLIHTDGTGRR